MRFVTPIIKVQNLRKVYRVGKEKVIALNDICLEIGEGEMCCIVGSSGSGKSTLLNQLAGLEKPTKGRVLIGKHDVSAMTENELAEFRQQHLGFIFQSYNLLPALTATENVALPLMFKGMPKKQREQIARAELKKMGLLARAKHKPTEMSGGQQQRVGIARAFAAKPKVIFADEPTGNLDSNTSRQVLYTMLEMAKEYGITFVMVTHERELANCGDRIVTIKDGRVMENVLLDDAEKERNRKQLFGDLVSGDIAEPETTVTEDGDEAPRQKKHAAAPKAQAAQGTPPVGAPQVAARPAVPQAETAQPAAQQTEIAQPAKPTPQAEAAQRVKNAPAVPSEAAQQAGTPPREAQTKSV